MGAPIGSRAEQDRGSPCGTWRGPCACDSKPLLLPGKRLRRVRAEMERMSAFLPDPGTVWGLDSSHTCCRRLFQRLLHWADGLNHGGPLSWLTGCFLEAPAFLQELGLLPREKALEKPREGAGLGGGFWPHFPGNER